LGAIRHLLDIVGYVPGLSDVVLEGSSGLTGANGLGFASVCHVGTSAPPPEKPWWDGFWTLGASGWLPESSRTNCFEEFNVVRGRKVNKNRTLASHAEFGGATE
jgi:hypothetical protein